MVSSPTILGTSRLEKIQAWFVKHPHLALTLVTIFALVPFLSKPFNLDDPLFVWQAQQIQQHPGDPFGFVVNWFGSAQPLWEAMQNPPLSSYYLAMAGTIFGWSEMGLHFAFLLPAVTVVLGTYRLARHFCRHPLFAALVTLFAPGFLVSATTLMCDVPMLCFWVWATVFWVEGIRENQFKKLIYSGVLVALAMLTKYNGICLVPLLAAFGWLERRSFGRWMIPLLIPLVAFGLNEWITQALYGQPHFMASNRTAQSLGKADNLTRFLKIVDIFVFIGGCFPAALFCLPWIWRKRSMLLLVAASLAGIGVLLATGALNRYELDQVEHYSAAIQMGIWMVGGFSAIALAGVALREWRDSGVWLLALWAGGIVAFAAYAYWMVNARVILPLAPAVAILVARGLSFDRAGVGAGIKFAVLAGAGLSLLAAQADFQQANVIRTSVKAVADNLAGQNTRVWFQGHWGFQYYMQQAGGWPVDIQRSLFLPGDLIVIPLDNSSNTIPQTNEAVRIRTLSMPVMKGLATMKSNVGAGFYSNIWGPLPFAFGNPMNEKYWVYRMTDPDQAHH